MPPEWYKKITAAKGLKNNGQIMRIKHYNY